MPRDQILQLLDHGAAPRLGASAIDDDRQGIHRLVIDQERHLHQVARLVTDDVIVERGIAARDRLEAVVEIEHHLVQRQLVDQHGARAGIGQGLLPPPPVLAELEHGAEMLVGHEDGGLDPRLLDLGDLLRIGHVGGIVQLLHGAVGHMHAVDDGGRRGDQVDIELALEPLADDLEMQQPEKAAAEAEAERGGGLHLIGEACVVEAELAYRLA